jgi:hypothetical protein
MSNHLTRRAAAVAGFGFALASAVANLTIGKFPDTDTPVAQLTAFYAQHHARVAAGGLIQAWAAVLLAVFVAAVYLRIRDTGSHPIAAVVALVGGAVATVGMLDDGSAYWRLGHLGNDHAIGAGALQAWHVLGSEGTLVGGGGTAVFLIAVAFGSAALPRWLAWAALPLGLAQLTPVGFFASLLFLVWAAAAGIYLAVRPAGMEHVGSARPLDPALSRG